MEKTVAPEVRRDQEYEFFNGFGGFREDGREYEILLDGENKPPSPWINVIANKNFGFQISESGAGFTWAGNSRENKITSWSNDPVTDRPSEVIYILDEIKGEVMTPVSLGRTDRGIYRARHGFGYSTFLHQEDQLQQELTVFTPLEEPVKLHQLRLKNHSSSVKYLNLTYYVEWVLGTHRENTSPYILTTYNNEYEYLRAKNLYTMNFQGTLAFLFTNERIVGYTGDRQEFLGQHGDLQNPQGADRKLSCSTGVCYDPCGAIQISIALMPEEEKTVIFGLGQCIDNYDIQRICNQYRNVDQVEEELNKVKEYWNKTLGVIQVHTRDRAIDIMVNGWLLYQTVSCRINARAAFYQCGGAYGFRDQLQDTFSLVFTEPDALRKQILISCSRQFTEGDVQHWWHPPTGVGVRTRITDDLLWLPYAVAVYIRTTGDEGILKEEVSYLTGPVLSPQQHEIMITPEKADLVENVYQHCKKTIEITRSGKHGLPLMGGGDWNDGMNEVGKDGVGESVWLAWFFYTVLGEFIPLCNKIGDTEYAKTLEEKRNTLISSIEANAWDGEWYLRAFYDDGTKLGSKDSEECRIDSISQSWSVISQGADKERMRIALQSAWRYLVREEDSMSLLLCPPFDRTTKNPGYIKNYIPGIRENGGQYTHAAVWLAIAHAIYGEYKKADTLFKMLNPIHITMNRKDALRYEKEPYVMIADISLSPPYTGRGGWSWYTGSAGWMYQGLVFWYLGIHKEKEELVIHPATPTEFGEYTIEYQYKTARYVIKISNRRNEEQKVATVRIDGIEVAGNRIPLTDDGKEHEVIV